MGMWQQDHLMRSGHFVMLPVLRLRSLKEERSSDYILWQGSDHRLYYFALKVIHTDIDAKYRKIKQIHYCCGVCTFAVLLTIHTWSATLAWFASYLGPRIGSDAAVSTVTAYQNDTLIAILPMYIPMVSFILIHFLMLLCGKTKYPRIMVLLHPVTINIILVSIPDIAQAIHQEPETWMSVMSQSSTNTSIIIWCIAAAVFERRSHAGKTFAD